MTSKHRRHRRRWIAGVGAAIGVVVTAGYAAIKTLPTTLSATALGGGIGAALTIGAVAGIYPALRASRLAPTEALRAV